MHDPNGLLFELSRLGLDIWHREPKGHDSGKLCGHPPIQIMSRTLWAVRHRRHLWVRCWPVFRMRHGVSDRCDHCGRKFRYRETRHSYQSTDRVWHSACMLATHVRGHLDDLTGYVLGTADANARWRAEYRLSALEHDAVKEVR